MAEEKPNIIPFKPNPLFLGMPDYLKDSANYEKIQKTIIEAGATKHSHGDLETFAACVPCQVKQHERAETMRKLGFRSGAQYMAWRKVMEMIRKPKRDPKR